MADRPTRFTPEEARAIWEALPGIDYGRWRGLFPKVSASIVACEWQAPLPRQRRAQCRACGRMIPPTSARIWCLLDYGNMWTTHAWYMHPEPCLEPASASPAAPAVTLPAQEA